MADRAKHAEQNRIPAEERLLIVSYISKLIDELDASVFNGDVLLDKDELANFKYHLQRWSKHVPAMEEIIKECENDES